MKPKLRFKEFNDEWNEYVLQNESDVRDGTHDSPKYVDSGYPLITSKNLTDMGTLDFSNVSYLKQEDFDKINQRSKVDIGDILFGMIGTIGKPVKIDRDDFAIKNVALIKEKGLIKNDYLIHYLHSPNINKQFASNQDGGTQKFIALDKIRKLKINMPSRNEQIKIVSLFDLLDKKIELQTKKIEDLKLFKSSQIINFFNKNNFAEVNIKNIGFFQSGNSLSKDCLTSSGVPIILYGDLYTKYNEVIKKVEQYTNDNKKYVKSKQNQIIFPTSTTVNSLSLISPSSINLDGIIYGGDILILNLNKDVNADFLSYEINHYKKKKFSKIAQGSTIIHIHAEDLLNCKIALPNIVLQDKFALTFNKLNQKIELENNKLNKLQKLKKGLMQSMFV